jgi:hypothetical protein
MSTSFRLAAGWSALLGVLAFYAILPVDAAADLRSHWASAPLLVIAGCYLSHLLPRRWFGAALTCFFVALGSATLIATWRSGYSDGSIIAGLLPYSDAAGYYSDAQRILLGYPVSSFSSRRPLFPSLLSILCAGSGNRLPLTLWLLLVMVAASLGYATAVLRRSWEHWFVPAVFAVLMWLFYRRFVGATMTEHLGLALGLLGFAWLWQGAERECRRSAGCGLFLLTLALNARAGAMFVLPAAAVWTATSFAGEGRKWSGKMLVISLGIIAAGFGCNLLVLTVAGGEQSGAFSNFSYVLYGLVHGGDWTLALEKHPELKLLSEQERTARIYTLAFEEVARRPLSLLAGAVKAWVLLPVAWFSYVVSQKAYLKSAFALRMFMTALLPLGLYFFVRNWKESPTARLLGWALLGIVASAPFVPPWDADGGRIYAATVPIMAMVGIFGLAQIFPGLRPHPSGKGEGPNGKRWGRAVFSACLVLALLGSLQLVRGRHSAAPNSPRIADCGGEGKGPFALLPGASVLLAEAGEPRPSLSKEVAEKGVTGALRSFLKNPQPRGVTRREVSFWLDRGHLGDEARDLFGSILAGERVGILAEHHPGGVNLHLAVMTANPVGESQGPGDQVCAERRETHLVIREP